MKDINGDELFNNDQVVITTKKGQWQSFADVIVENDRYFFSYTWSANFDKFPLTEQLIKEFEVTKYKKDNG